MFHHLIELTKIMFCKDYPTNFRTQIFLKCNIISLQHSKEELELLIEFKIDLNKIFLSFTSSLTTIKASNINNLNSRIFKKLCTNNVNAKK